jgi:DNA modification methylase
MSTRVLTGDCRTILPTLEAGSVHCCVTSPPYFGLRDYGTATWDGGDPSCDHAMPVHGGAPSASSTLRGNGHVGGGPKLQALHSIGSSACPKCGAVRSDGQIGLESSPDEYVAEMVGVFREVRRVLRDDGTLWLNIGDSYASPIKGSGGAGRSTLVGTPAEGNGQMFASRRFDMGGLKPKDLIGIPWLLAFALRADGWYLRQDIIWAKQNPMPESVRDRCTKAHEYVFLLSKSERYHFDAVAISEPFADARMGSSGARASKYADARSGRSGGDCGITSAPTLDTRNRRSVWSIASQPFADAHFATMPPALAEPCILAGCPEWGTVLDPFGGAGTTGLVADRLQRHAILVELNPDYAAMAAGRIRGDAPLFADVG